MLKSNVNKLRKILDKYNDVRHCSTNHSKKWLRQQLRTIISLSPKTVENICNKH